MRNEESLVFHEDAITYWVETEFTNIAFKPSDFRLSRFLFFFYFLLDIWHQYHRHFSSPLLDIVVWKGQWFRISDRAHPTLWPGIAPALWSVDATTLVVRESSTTIIRWFPWRPTILSRYHLRRVHTHRLQRWTLWYVYKVLFHTIWIWLNFVLACVHAHILNLL